MRLNGDDDSFVVHCVSCGVFVHGEGEEDAIRLWNEKCHHHFLYKDWVRLKMKFEPEEKVYPGTAADSPYFEAYYPAPELPLDPSKEDIYY